MSTQTDCTGREWNFYHPEYAIGCGGTESPILYNGKRYLYVWHRKTKVHEYYVFEDDMMIPDSEAPWLDSWPSLLADKVASRKVKQCHPRNYPHIGRN